MNPNAMDVTYYEPPTTPPTSTKKAYRAASAEYLTGLNNTVPDPIELRRKQEAAELRRRQDAADECDSVTLRRPSREKHTQRN